MPSACQRQITVQFADMPSPAPTLLSIKTTLKLMFCVPLLTITVLATPVAPPKPAPKPLPVVIAPKLIESSIVYTSDKLRVKARFFAPVGAGPFPGLVYSHGGITGLSPSALERCRDLARAGYAVVAPSYRGEDGSEGVVEVAAGEVSDVENALIWLRGQKTVQKDNIALIGTSHGALINLLLANRLGKNTQGVKALVFAYGVTDIYQWYQYLIDSKQLGTDAITVRTYGKGPKDKPDNFRVRNGITQTKAIAVPVLILQGEKDTTVPRSQAQLLHDTLLAQQKASQIKFYPNSEHAFLVSRTGILQKHDQKSVQYQESLEAWNDMLVFLKEKLK
jgi:dienelactone hydrolase